MSAGKSLAIILLALSCAVRADVPTADADEVNAEARFPTLSGKDLNGKAWKAPGGLPGDRTLVILGYEQEQQDAIDTWTEGMGLGAPENELPWIEMPVIDEPGFVMRWIIDTGMQRGIPDRRVRGRVWTAYTDRGAFLKSCGIDSMRTIHLLVVTRDGEILAVESGRHTEEAAGRLRAALGRE